MRQTGILKPHINKFVLKIVILFSLNTNKKDMSSDNLLITKMINEIRATRTSMKAQNAAIADVMEKSNNVLLQIEASRSLKPAINDNSTPYTYNKETSNVLNRIVDKFMNLLCDSDNSAERRSFEDYLEESDQMSDFLGCNIRKLLAIFDTIQKMRTLLDRRELELKSNDESEIEECFYNNFEIN